MTVITDQNGFVFVSVVKKSPGQEDEKITVRIAAEAIARNFLWVCECGGEVAIEAEQVFCKLCGKPQDCGDTVIKKACRRE